MHLTTALLAAFSIASVFVSYRAALDVRQNLSPQGCRMSWMSPSYILQNAFNTSLSPLASRYSLWLYREVGWESNELRGVPVLFIPGNAGSSHQVRSIASSATRQFYSLPSVVAVDFASRSLKPLDFFAVEFNEDFSALHGPTIDSQVAYSSDAISYILSHYPPNTPIIVIGHSMGGIVATSLLPSPNISAIITMSTPHALPPARFDSRIDKIYSANQHTLISDPTPILSLCGGATDMTIPSESCILPTLDVTQHVGSDIYRRSVFTSALEGAWTGVGHREMVWCHQVRWRIAKAALELGAASSAMEKGSVLDRWLRDGHVPPSPNITSTNGFSSHISLTDPNAYETAPVDVHLVLKAPRGSRMYLLPVLPSAPSSTFVLFVSQGSIPPVSPQSPLPLRACVYLCTSTSQSNDPPECGKLQSVTLKLIPNPIPGKAFPVPDEGSDESEGVVLFEADIPPPSLAEEKRWIGVLVEGGDGRGWVVGGMNVGGVVKNDFSVLSLILGTVSIPLPEPRVLRMHISLPNLMQSVLIVYRLTPKRNSSGTLSRCSEPSLLSPLLAHTSFPPETHYFSLANSRSHALLLHTHGSAPYIPSLRPTLNRGFDFTIYTTELLGCDSDISAFDISIDWWTTIGRCAARYPTTLLCWAIGVVALTMSGAWGQGEKSSVVPSIQKSLTTFGVTKLPKLLALSFVISFLPLPKQYYIGNEGEPIFAPLAPLLLLVATGLVCASWWLLGVLMWPIGKVGTMAFGNRREEVSVRRSSLLSMGFVFLLIFLFIPWQVAFLGCWVIHLYTCALPTVCKPFPGSTPSLAPSPSEASIPLVKLELETDDDEELRSEEQERHAQIQYHRTNNRHHNMHLLLLMTWLLPLAAPVLAAWVRTLMTAGLSTPFGGDHFFLNVAPFFILVDFASWTSGPLFERQKFENILSVRWSLVVLALASFFVGPRTAYVVFDVAKIGIGLIVIVRVGPRYWGGPSWT